MTAPTIGAVEAERPGAPPALLLCPLCGAAVGGWGPGPANRPNAKCEPCGALERHRFMALLLRAGRSAMPGQVVLDIAPLTMVTDLIRALGPRQYVRLDMEPAKRAGAVDVQGSLTALALRDGSVDLMICYHVLEHIPDDAAAMREIARVLAPGGRGLLQVPYRASALTDEDPDADVETRIRRFGQYDHVRLYGHDFEDRLRTAGLRITRIEPEEILGPDLCTMFGVLPREKVWIVSPACSTVPEPAVADLRQEALVSLAQTLAVRGAESEARATELRGDLADARRRVTALEEATERREAERREAERRKAERREAERREAERREAERREAERREAERKKAGGDQAGRRGAEREGTGRIRPERSGMGRPSEPRKAAARSTARWQARVAAALPPTVRDVVRPVVRRAGAVKWRAAARWRNR